MNRSPEQILDELLVLQAQDGDRDALTQLVSRWHGRLLRHASRLTGRSDAAADIVQDSWLAIVKGLRRLDDPACFPRWAFQIVTRRSADWTRGKIRHRKLVAEAAGTQPLNQETTDGNENLDPLRTAIRQLPAERRTLLSMHYLDGLSIAEIAEILSIAPGTVKSRLYHTRNELRSLLDSNMPVETSEQQS